MERSNYMIQEKELFCYIFIPESVAITRTYVSFTHLKNRYCVIINVLGTGLDWLSSGGKTDRVPASWNSSPSSGGRP